MDNQLDRTDSKRLRWLQTKRTQSYMETSQKKTTKSEHGWVKSLEGRNKIFFLILGRYIRWNGWIIVMIKFFIIFVLLIKGKPRPSRVVPALRYPWKLN